MLTKIINWDLFLRQSMKLLRHFNNFGWIFAMGLYASKKMVAWSIFTTQENCLKLLHFFFINKHIHVFHWYEIYQTSLWTGHIHYAFCYYIPIYVLTVTPPPSPNTNYPPITWPQSSSLTALKEDCTVNYGLRHSFLTRPREMMEENKMT